MNKHKTERFAYHSDIAQTPLPTEEWPAARHLLAKLIARAYIADHPELFGAGQRHAADTSMASNSDYLQEQG